MSKIIISINEKGIKIKSNPRYLWSEIQLEKITVKHTNNPDSRQQPVIESNYLYFFHNDEKTEIQIDDFDITDYQLAQVLKIFRTRYNNSGL
ncbi:hypothetical protein J3D55_002060 [Chryseobacterium ginsenosidimutans]|uniref:hypothetical protein n=1 Tax=Chryseobacterium ginsenosidimutans TaxID=687846 RepID=UPI00216A722C|nr:hypothetical protein [Chryseobacterium ginsenosidimutans]MCS3869144.1 hypothetical protein [Chryseobacterium ginsenosidimutans]